MKSTSKTWTKVKISPDPRGFKRTHDVKWNTFWTLKIEMKSTVYHYYGPKRKGRCCKQFTVKNWALTSAIYTLVSKPRVSLVRRWKRQPQKVRKCFVNDLWMGLMGDAREILLWHFTTRCSFHHCLFMFALQRHINLTFDSWAYSTPQRWNVFVLPCLSNYHVEIPLSLLIYRIFQYWSCFCTRGKSV